MSAVRLGQPYLDGGVRSTYFFNGRIVSREDMAREQDAERTVHDRLGLAVGDGVVRGLGVTAKQIGGSSAQEPVVTVKRGLAVNRRGQTLALDRDVDVLLRRDTSAGGTVTVVAPAGGGLFGDCAPPQSTLYVVGTGVYLLSMAPAQTKEGLAVVSGLGNGVAPCNAKSIVSTVSFRLAQVKLTAAELADEAHLRNVVAYRFFLAEGAGTGGVADPFGAAPPAAAPLTDPPPSDGEVPLCLIHWTNAQGIRYVDTWAVRRAAERAEGAVTPVGAEDRRRALGLAVEQQFQRQLEELRAPGAFSITARSRFRWLPPAGVVPLGLSAGDPGFSIAAFFDGFKVRKPLFVEAARARPFLRAASCYAPFDAQTSTLVWLYHVRDNRQPDASRPAAVPYVIFARGEIDYMGEPRFDVAHFDYANFSLYP
jgi:hypothetical protein